MDDISTPTCSKCAWFKEAQAPDGGRLGVNVQSAGRDGFRVDGQVFKALGAGYCEHQRQPRGLVLTNYQCPNFLRPMELDEGHLSLAHKDSPHRLR